VVESVIPEVISLGVLHKVLQALLNERVAVRDMATIVETVSDYIGSTKEPDVLAEYVRMALKRQITDMYRDNSGKITVFTIDPALEQKLAESVQNTKQGLMLLMDPVLTEKLLQQIGRQVEQAQSGGQTPICICSPNVRLALRRLIEAGYPSLAVISYNEVLPNVEIVSTGMVRLEDED
jgi:flagellar biosynthesis protein FlhA